MTKIKSPLTMKAKGLSIYCIGWIYQIQLKVRSSYGSTCRIPAIVTKTSNYFQQFSRCTAGLNRASNAIAIFTLIHGLLTLRLETGNKANLSWQDIVLKSDKAGAATPNKTFRIPRVNKRQEFICRPITGLNDNYGK